MAKKKKTAPKKKLKAKYSPKPKRRLSPLIARDDLTSPSPDPATASPKPGP
jgi:hypothetical protein